MRSGLQSLLKETQRFGPPSGFIRLQGGLETLHQRGLLRRQREKANSPKIRVGAVFPCN